MTLSPTILVVDDSSFQHAFLRRYLVPAGYVVAIAHNGKEALEVLDSRPVDCVLADLIMPEMRGVTLLEELRRRDDPPPVVILTADIQEHVRRQCLGLGARAVLHKPVRPEVLLETLAEIFDGDGDGDDPKRRTA